jgi:hypothetical protein
MCYAVKSKFVLPMPKKRITRENARRTVAYVSERGLAERHRRSQERMPGRIERLGSGLRP